MAIVFAYTVATNTVVVTGGTSGTPATFADFVTADRAGTGTSLKAATAASKTLTLTYAVRPVELLAIVVKLIVASKTTETDYLFITGTDAWDAAQTENIDVSAGNGTYTSTKRWRTISNISCSDATDGTGTVWANGTLAVTQDIWGVIWNKGNSQYQVNAIFTIGDASTSTVFTQLGDEAVYFPVTATPTILASATYNMGALSGTYSGNGAFLKFPSLYLTPRFINGGTFNAYGSLIHCYNNALSTVNGAFNLYESTWVGNGTGGTSGLSLPNTTTLNLRNVYFFNIRFLQYQSAPTTYENVWIHVSAGGLYAFGADFTAISPKVTTFTNDYQSGGGGGNIDLYIVNPAANVTAPAILNAETNRIWEQYRCDINVCDKDGAALSDAVVDCEDSTATAVWTAGTVTTDASGNITQQTISYKKWTGTSETLTEYSPHKFTISKAGYQTLVLENITVSAPIKWHVELQAPGVDKGAMLYDIDKGKFVRVLSDKTCLSF